MTYSIYHFFLSLIHQKHHFKGHRKLDRFPFEFKLLSFQLPEQTNGEGVFPNLAIRINKDKRRFTGGELIELKDSDSYTVSSFNSTIPSGSKKIEDIIKGENSTIGLQMKKEGDNITSLPVRDVFYLVRGTRNNNMKVCLVHGSFFETIKKENLINQSFSQVIEETMRESDINIPEERVKLLISVLSEQANFRRVRTVRRAAVGFRFWITAEVKSEANILNSGKYPDIKDNTLNLVLPFHDENEERVVMKKAENAFKGSALAGVSPFKIKHHFNGPFLVYQISL